LRKIVILLILGIFIQGCSATKKRQNISSRNSNILLSGNVLESVKYQNITDNNIFIQKAEIELITENGSENFIGSIKYEKSGKYLISLRGRSGIEGARIYITEDSMLVNDRINKKLYFGSSIYLRKKYGLDQSFLPLIFGDIILDKECEVEPVKCLENLSELDCQVNGVILNYIIDCKKRKIILADQVINFVQQGVKLNYESFLNLGSILMPRNIEIENAQNDLIIKIRIIKVEYPWNGSIKFVPGKGYEIIELI